MKVISLNRNGLLFTYVLSSQQFYQFSYKCLLWPVSVSLFCPCWQALWKFIRHETYSRSVLINQQEGRTSCRIHVLRSVADSSIKNKPCEYLQFRNDLSSLFAIYSWCHVFGPLFVTFYHYHSHD